MPSCYGNYYLVLSSKHQITTEFLRKHLTFKPALKTQYDSLMVPIEFPYLIKTPYCVAPFRINQQPMFHEEEPKYSIPIHVDDQTHPRFHKLLETIDEYITDVASENCREWFKRKTVDKFMMDQLYTPLLKKHKNRQTGEYDKQYPDMITFKLPLQTNKDPSEYIRLYGFKNDCPNNDNVIIPNTLKEAVDMIGTHKIIASVTFSNKFLWFGGGMRFGIKTEISKLQIKKVAKQDKRKILVV